jgi:hypothetical protein
MFGLEDLLGGLLPNFNFANPQAPQQPGVVPPQTQVPNINAAMPNLMAPNLSMGMGNGQPPLSNPLLNKMQMPVTPVPASIPQAPPLPSALNANPAGANPEALGVSADPSNPMKNDMMRKLMMMQFLTKQQGKQQDQMPNMQTGLGGGPRPGPGMGMAPNASIAPVNSMPNPMQQRPRFLTG